MQLKTVGFLVSIGLAFSAHSRPLEVKCSEVGKVISLVKQSVAPQNLKAQSWINLTPQDLGNGKCAITLGSLLKTEIQHLADREQPMNGMNCWSSALYLRGLRPIAIYAHEPEFRWFVDQSKACRKLSKEEAPKTGDIGAIRKQASGGVGKYEELHAFLYLTSALAISKQSYAYDAEVELTQPDYFFKAFGGKERGVECESEGTCDTWTTYYRCDTKAVDARTLDPDTALYDKILALAQRTEQDLKNGVVIEKDENLQNSYLSQITELNNALFSAKPAPVMTYGRTLFESAVWQFSTLQAGAKTPAKGNN